MRHSTILLLAGLLAGGCATTRQAGPASAGPPAAVAARYSEAASSALAFDPPIDSGIPHPELARAGRDPAAFLGFDQDQTEFYTTASDNLQTDFGDFFVHESISIRSGVRSR